MMHLSDSIAQYFKNIFKNNRNHSEINVTRLREPDFLPTLLANIFDGCEVGEGMSHFVFQ